MNKIKLLLLALLFVLNACDNTGGGAAEPGEEGLPEVKTVEYKLPAVDKCATPKRVKDLTSGMRKEFYQVNADNIASLSIFGGSGIQLGKKEMVVIVDFMQFKDLKCEEDARYGVGVRLFLKIRKAHKRIDLNHLPSLAANVELGRASVEYDLRTIGITGDKINALIPKSNTNVFDVEGYASVINAVDEIQRLIRDDIPGVVIDPQLIPKK